MSRLQDAVSNKVIFDSLSFMSKEFVLDAGTGTGKNLDYIPSSVSLTAVDINKSMLSLAKKRAKKQGLNVNWVTADLRQLPFKDNSFDTTIESYVLSGSSNSKKVFSELLRVTKPGGRIALLDFITAPLHPAGGFGSLDLVSLIDTYKSEYIVGSVKRFISNAYHDHMLYVLELK